MNTQQRGRSKAGRGWQAERTSWAKEEEEQENKGRAMSGVSHPATLQAVEKEVKNGIHHEACLWISTENIVEELRLTPVSGQAVPGYYLGWKLLPLPTLLPYMREYKLLTGY